MLVKYDVPENVDYQLYALNFEQFGNEHCDENLDIASGETDAFVIDGEEKKTLLS